MLTDHRFYRGDDHLVAVAGERIVGFVGTQVDRSEADAQERSGGISVVLVHPELAAAGHRHGVARGRAGATMLPNEGVGIICASAAAARTGFGRAFRRIFPSAYKFFAACGWPLRPGAAVVRPGARPKRFLHAARHARTRLAQENVTVRPGPAGAKSTDVIAFEFEHFPGWAAEHSPTWRNSVISKICSSPLTDEDKGIVGTLMLHTPTSRWLGANVVWKTLLGDALGGISAVGVAASERGRGIGIGMVAVGSEVLRERGVGNCHIDWTRIVDFYGKLGYKVWREYWMSTRALA